MLFFSDECVRWYHWLFNGRVGHSSVQQEWMLPMSMALPHVDVPFCFFSAERWQQTCGAKGKRGGACVSCSSVHWRPKCAQPFFLVWVCAKRTRLSCIGQLCGSQCQLSSLSKKKYHKNRINQFKSNSLCGPPSSIHKPPKHLELSITPHILHSIVNHITKWY